MEHWTRAINNAKALETWELEWRATIALELMRQVDITGIMGTAEYVAEQACALADELVTRFEQRGWIRPAIVTHEEEAEWQGQMARITEDERYEWRKNKAT